PFGFLKPSTSSNSVQLYVLPYNYPRLWPLLGEYLIEHTRIIINYVDDLVNNLKMTPSVKWKQDFDKYLASIPSYYYTPLRNGNMIEPILSFYIFQKK